MSSNPNWKGGRTITSDGYVLVKVGKGHPLADSRGYAYEHRIEGAKAAGRALLPGEQVHHENRTRSDNRHENLDVQASVAHHRAQHRRPGSLQRNPGEPNVVVDCACGCGAQLQKFDGHGRPRRFISGHNLRP